jgi:hypothetical protein
MERILLTQFVALSLYTLFVGFCFCDGFNLRIGRKLVWFIFFLVISAYVLRVTSQFALSLILPFPTLLAMVLCKLEQREHRKTA